MRVEIPSFEKVPSRIGRLPELAYNLWWSWNLEGRALFKSLDLVLWRKTTHNPVQMLLEVPAEKLGAAAQDPAFVELYDRVMANFDHYMASSQHWFSRSCPEAGKELVAYLCAEFAFHVSIPIYSGGLGLLSADTCKEASDLGIPFIAVGALYPEGYFRQVIEADGRQTAVYERIHLESAPILPVLREDGSRFLVPVPVGDREINVAVWRLQAGRVPVFLMDTDIEENEIWDRDLAARLYGGDTQVRIRQEIILGMGGVRVVRALGFEPTVWHLNEGHASFAILELLREFTEQGKPFEESLNCVRESLVFTTHTPVKAGHDEFPFYMMEEHFHRYWEALGITRQEFLELGAQPDAQCFSMSVLALLHSRCSNGVSRRHGEVSREMWHFLFPGREVEGVPITSVTNGVHVPTWISPEMVELYAEYLGEDWFEHHDEARLWDRIWDIPDEKLWYVHLRLKSKLLNFVRERARGRWVSNEVSPGQIVAFGALLSPEILTLGFARRFATYKRANLILRDVERLQRMLQDVRYPLQIIFSGKPHPADEPGKHLLKEVFEICTSSEFGGRIAFIENYDKHVAHYLVAGVDVWLNNPDPPKEASGTSGQKASLNGVANLSVLDGWWFEGYNGRNGWAIEGEGDTAAAESLYSVLETDMIPRYYSKDSSGVPREWVRVMKEAIHSAAAPFSTRRMLKEYVRQIYGIGKATFP